MSGNEFKESLQITSENSKKYKQILENSIHKISDTYLKANTLESKQYLCYMISAIFLTYQKLYPDLSIYIPFRIKSDDSFTKNIKKEFKRKFYLTDLSKTFSDIDTLSEEELENSFLPIEKTTDDIMAATVVLTHVKNSVKPNIKYSSETIDKLFQEKDNNLIFINSIDKKLEEGFIDEKEYLEYKQQILERLLRATYPSFTLERSTPYKDELNGEKAIYEEKLKTFNFASSISPAQEANLQELLDDLRSRLSDKLEYEILRETLPNVLNDPLLKNALKVEFEFSKDAQKPNGFAALFYILQTPFGKVELQAQSNERYRVCKKGSAFHSGIIGKELNINSFFELVDKNDEHDLDYYLSKLDSVPVDTLISDIEIPPFSDENEKQEFLKTDLGKKYLYSKKIDALASHIRIKDNFISHSSTQQPPSEIPINNHLLGLAQFTSPHMNVCSSGHTSLSTASIHHKSLIDEFSEILRKRDATTYLGEMLITRLASIIENKEFQNDSNYKKNAKISNTLPRVIARKDILNYAEKLSIQLKQKENSTEKELDEI